jgi:hypothetical protein
MITPTPGRIVWFYRGETQSDIVQRDQPLAATVCYVFSNRMVNLRVWDADANEHRCTSVQLLQDGDEAPPTGYYCEWMPYQKRQAARHENAA